MALVTECIGPADILILDGSFLIAKIRGLELANVRLRQGGAELVPSNVPIPLYWRQYAGYQDPDRNASVDPQVQVLPSDQDDRLAVVCSGKNASGSITSHTSVEFVRRDGDRYEIGVRTVLQVRENASWRVTPNLHHGEVEFLTLFPSHAFTPSSEESKRYQACYLDQGGKVWRIPHHHLESADKHNIVMQKQDRFFWLLEDENPCMELLSDQTVTAGLCAYMWDGHFAYKVCTEDQPVDLPGGTRFEAAYRLTSVDREEGSKLVEVAQQRDAPGINDIPLYIEGVNRFATTWKDVAPDAGGMWSWEPEINRFDDGAVCSLDRATGFDDSSSLRIDGCAGSLARWVATTIGPAFGGPPFKDRARYRLEAFLRTGSLLGRATVSIRLHRQGREGLFDSASYEVFRAREFLSGDTPWTRLTVETPPISPPPDRLHILLEHDGAGTTWFDNVLLEEQ